MGRRFFFITYVIIVRLATAPSICLVTGTGVRIQIKSKDRNTLFGKQSWSIPSSLQQQQRRPREPKPAIWSWSYKPVPPSPKKIQTPCSAPRASSSVEKSGKSRLNTAAKEKEKKPPLSTAPGFQKMTATERLLSHIKTGVCHLSKKKTPDQTHNQKSAKSPNP